MSEYKTHNDTKRSNFSILDDINSAIDVIDSDKSASVSSSNSNLTDSDLTISQRDEQFNTDSQTTEVETTLAQRLKTKTAATLVGSAVMLPILAVGTATYYFGSKAVNKQAILARRLDNIGLTQAELVRQQKLLAALLMGTGTTALIAGGVAGWGTKRLLDYIERKSTKSTAEDIKTEVKKISNFNPSATQKEILKKIVKEAHAYLQCDRAIVYSLDRDRYGKIIAESVIPAYTKALGKTIEDPCLEFQNRDKYQSGLVTAIDNIYEAQMGQHYIEQLETLEVKASLVTPIVNHDKLWGLLVAHQCQSPRQWQQTEIDFLSQLSKKAGLALENARLSGDIANLQTQTNRERKWTHEFTDVVQYIRQSLKEDDILDTSVKEVRKVLKCDRVVVYSLDSDRYGVVVAESVALGYTKALHKTIEDPCFETRYLDKYRDGRVRAIDNIYEAGMSQCYIEQLETLEVKANLVTPILNEGRLFGLLVAHQCSDTRQWQDYEIRWMTQIATQVGFALDNALLLAQASTRQEQALTERKWTQYFTNAVQYIRQSIKEDDVLDTSVEEVRRVLKSDRVVVYSLDSDRYGVVIAESVAPGYTKALHKTIEDPCFETRYLDKYRDGRVRAIDNIYEAGMSQCYIEQLETLEVKANLVTPILNEGRLFGLLVAHQCSDTRQWQDYEIRWMTQIATQVGFALDNALLLTKSRKNAKATQLLKNFSLSIDVNDKWQLLTIAVEQIRKGMELDRVMVYQFDENWNGTIVAESVVAGYPRAKNSEIDLPYWARDYPEYYRNKIQPESTERTVTAIANIKNANLSNYCFQQLESLDVKASLVIPILQQGQLFGLLIAHQCEQTRFWEQSAIDLFTQIALQLETALQRVNLKEKLDLVQISQDREARQQQQISQLITENKAALEELKAQVNYHSTATDNFPRVESIKRTTITTPDSQQFNYHNLTEAQRAIAQTEETEMLQQSHQLYQMANLIDDIKATIDETTTVTTQLPAMETNEITVRSVNTITEQLASQDATNSILMNQFMGEIANLSHQISQQSLAINNSFQKLAAFAKQLSRKDW